MAKALVAVTAAPAARPDLLDIAGLLMQVSRDEAPVQRVALIDAAQILLGRMRNSLTPAPVAEPERSAPSRGGVKRKRGVKRNAAGGAPTPAADPPPQPPEPPAPVVRAVNQAPRPEAEDDAEIVDANGVTVTIGADGGNVQFGESMLDVNVRQARLVACLARAMPQPVGRDFIAKKIWAGARVPDAADTMISSLMAPIAAPLAQIGLTLKTVRGIGVALQKAGE